MVENLNCCEPFLSVTFIPRLSISGCADAFAPIVSMKFGVKETSPALNFQAPAALQEHQ